MIVIFVRNVDCFEFYNQRDLAHLYQFFVKILMVAGLMEIESSKDLKFYTRVF